jgi:hypothetical protein
VLAIALLMLVLLPVARAGAQAPTITIASPLNDAVIDSPSPSFSGSTDDPLDEVTLAIYSGASAEGIPVQSFSVLSLEEAWSAGPAAELPDGTYTAEATQTKLLLEADSSTPVTFTVDTVAPIVSLMPSAPSTNDSTLSFSGEAGTAIGDCATVELQLYAGGAPVTGGPIDTIEVVREGATWSTGSIPALPDGPYTAQAEQSDEAGNIGLSAPFTFTVDTVAPTVSLSSVPTPTNDASPSLSGDAGLAVGDSGTVRLTVYAGSTTSGSPVQSLEVPSNGGTWTAGPLASLPGGVYTAEAEQADAAGNVGLSEPSTFTVDTTPPAVTMTSPIQNEVTTGSSQPVEGRAGTAEGDLSSITIKLFAGSNTGARLREKVTVEASGDHWSATLGGLSEGTYTVICQQSDDVGNTGESGPVTFVVKPSASTKETAPPAVPEITTPTTPAPEPPTSTTATSQTSSPSPEPPPVHLPPAASFTWFPVAPQVGQVVSLISSSSDSSSPIVALAWGLGEGPLQAGGSVLTTSFATPGPHVVRLRAAAADGLASTATEEIPVSSAPVALMQPFPIVRIAGTDTARGAKLTLLTVDAPAGARITVVCHGRGCPAKAASRIAASAGGGSVLIEFHRFERALRAGAVIEIRVSESGEIGKYTRFQIRRGKLPERTDSCLSPALQPMSCPSS